MSNKDNKLYDFKPDFEQGKFPDIFDTFNDEVEPLKLFLWKEHELPRIYKVNVELNMKRYMERLIEGFGLQDADFILKEEYSKDKRLKEIDYEYAYYLVRLKKGFWLDINPARLTFYYSPAVPREEIGAVLDMVPSRNRRKRHRNKFYMVATNKQSEYGFELKNFDVKAKRIDIRAHYNDDFQPVHDNIRAFLADKKRNGVVLLHGAYGTGKTSYLRHIMGNMDVRFIFLPTNMVGELSNPNFLPFLSNYKDSVLVLEDCEEIIRNRKSMQGDSHSLANLLNVGDGLLSDALAIKLVCTFNADVKQVDPAVLREGRLVARYEFTPLSIEKTRNLKEKIGVGGGTDRPMTLAEIYNSADTGFKPEEKKIGF